MFQSITSELLKALSLEMLCAVLWQRRSCDGIDEDPAGMMKQNVDLAVMRSKDVPRCAVRNKVSL